MSDSCLKCGRSWNDHGVVCMFDALVEIKPHTCPVCYGNGKVSNGFYNSTSGHWSTTDVTPEKCRSCDGSGVIWR